MRVLVHGNPFSNVLPLSSNYDKRPVSSVNSTALTESLRVVMDDNIYDVYLAGYVNSNFDTEADPSRRTSSVVVCDLELSPPNKRTPSGTFQQR